MQQVFDQVDFLVGNREILAQIEYVHALSLFSERVLFFFDCLSKRLMHSSEAKKYPDVIAYAFWIRKASLERVSNQYRSNVQKMGRGVAFQIAPSNIPIQFAVSMTYALTAGNASIVRISDKKFEQVNIICETVQSVLNDSCPEMAPYICVVRYPHNDEITQILSKMCDVRMIWGGNKTIEDIRKATIDARCIDLGFADRYSIAVIDADDYMKKDALLVADDFYNDTYFSDQNACSSPRLVIWMGDQVSEAKELFWSALDKIVSEKYLMEPICSSDKLLKTAVCSAEHPGIREVKNSNLLVRIEITSLYDNIMDYKGNCGYFFEYDMEDMQEIVPILKKDCQTISYIGDIEDKLRKLISDSGVKGVDRIVPVGHAADIAFVWDGLDLPNILSRQIGNV